MQSFLDLIVGEVRSREFRGLHHPIPTIVSFPTRKTSGIQLHSSQNNNVVLFFVVRKAYQDETNLLITKHLQTAFQISTDTPVEKSAARDGPFGKVSVGSRFVVVGQFIS
jgi:hypothetical protein